MNTYAIALKINVIYQIQCNYLNYGVFLALFANYGHLMHRVVGGISNHSPWGSGGDLRTSSEGTECEGCVASPLKGGAMLDPLTTKVPLVM